MAYEKFFAGREQIVGFGLTVRKECGDIKEEAVDGNENSILCL